MFSSPFGYQRPGPYYDSDPYYPRQSWGHPQQYRRPAGVDPDEANARARALAAQRARRAQWLPEEVDDEPEYDDWEYRSLPPREQMLLEAARRRQLLEQQQRQQEYARQRAMEEARWQQQLEQRQREEDERRQRILEEQRRIQQLRREREEARLRAAEAVRQQSRARSQSRQRQGSPPHSPSSHKIPIDDKLPSPSKSQSPPPKPPTPRPQYDERHEEAASKIQNQYRIHRSFQTIQSLEKQFKDAQNRFTFPSSIDFQRPGSDSNEGHDHISVPASRDPNAPPSEDMDVDGQPEGKLAYTSNNFALNAHLDGMLKLLTKLDGVESWGEKRVRERRRKVVKEIEIEMARVDGYWKGVWSDYLASQRQESKRQSEEERPQEPLAVEQVDKEMQRAKEGQSEEGAEEKVQVDEEMQAKEEAQAVEGMRPEEEMRVDEEVQADEKAAVEEPPQVEDSQDRSLEDQSSPAPVPDSAPSPDQPSEQVEAPSSLSNLKMSSISSQTSADRLEQAWL